MAHLSRADEREEYRALLRDALELPAAERDAFLLERLRPGKTLDEARALVAGVDDLGAFLEAPLGASPAASASPIPERIGPYAVERVLGWGSAGVVYLAQQSSPRRPVALKVLRIDRAGPSAVDRFRREIRALAQLDHPGIATVYEAGVADLGVGEQSWFAMEFVDGLPLTAYADRAGLDRRERIALLLRVARAVHHVHDQGVVHRDLKPENVLVREDGTVRVVDFGVARVRDDDAEHLTLTATGQVVGTLAYMAPEQARGGVVDERADQFALGAMLYELLTGELPLPIRGRLPHDALRVIAEGAWTSPTRYEPGLRGDVVAILATALASEPNRRYATVGAFADDLERFLDGRSVAARRPTKLDGVLRVVRRYPLAFAAVAAALLVTGAVSAIALRSSIDRRRANAVAMVMSDSALLGRLRGTVDELWPADSRTLPEIEAWLGSASDLRGRFPKHERWLEGVADRGESPGSNVVGEIESAWLVQEGEAFVASMQTMFAPGGTYEAVLRRHRDAEQLHRRTVDDHRDAWRAAAERVAADPRFADLVLLPQEGLVPLGPDPLSGLEEFAVHATGAIPARDDPSGCVVPRTGDALTLVLVPSSSGLVGGQSVDPDGEHYAAPPGCSPHEGPPVRLDLDPFLISKFEMTQDQWRRCFGSNPADWDAGSEIQGATIDGLHPVESMTWEETVRLLPRYGLTLPTEAQWEVAALGGSACARLFGDEVRDCIGLVNWASHREEQQERYGLPDDGIYPHSRVGTFPPNRYGLHDVLGNVWELCLDVYKVDYHELEHRPGDGLVLAEADGDVSRRGGSCLDTPASMHVYARSDRLANDRDTLTGLRPARSVRR
ncbi:MAG: bifunctional serine/threonine-protein kinase/formylglycine-generating enzyme family protein [Planctomycetota bacterium]